MRRNLLFLLVALAIASPIRSETFKKLRFGDGEDTVVGSLHLHLSGPDDPSKPTLWQGPLRITRNGKSCEAHVSLVNAVWVADESDLAIVITENGSITYVQFVDISSCAQRWPRIKAFTEDVRVLPDRLEILPGCSCDKTDAPCSCSAARVYKLQGDRAPALLGQASRRLTKQVLGVEFRGNRSVLRPKTPQARLVPQ
jgi:hypothetical protein